MVILNDHSPMARTRVLYIGSAVPLDTAMGLDAVQGPLKERYQVDNEEGIQGIDAWLTVTNSCIQMQYLNDTDQIVQFPVSSLTLCAAVRCISMINSATGENGSKFVSLNDPQAGGENAKRPAIFTAITRRTKGKKVLECHGFICSSSRDALNLVKCASIAGKNYKQNGTIKSSRPSYQVSANANGTTDPLYDAASTLNRLSNGPSAFSAPQAAQNGVSNGNMMRLIPGEPVSNITAGPEFFEPVSTQGYFYSSNNAEIKKYNIAKLGRQANKENLDTTHSAPSQHPTLTQMNGYTATPTPRAAPAPRPAPVPPPVYVRLPQQQQQYAAPPPMPPPPMPMFYGPPPPMYGRPRFFSPPPPRFRPQPFMMPPGAPPPMMAPPLFVRRPRRDSAGSRSRSNSSGSRGSRDSRSKPPTRQFNEETRPKRIPNADDSSEESEIRVFNRQRPSTPPTDYDDRRKGERMSRRDAYEVKYGVQPNPQRYGPPPDGVSPYDYNYYVQPPRHGGYAPFTMYNPHGRARSVPGNDRHRSKSPRKKKGKKKNKKSKKNKPKQPPVQYVYHPREGYTRRPVHDHSDVSTDSVAGYHSEIPRASQRADPTSGYQFYPPRDFRRDENQYMNERNFSKSIKAEDRRSRDSKAYPTAYELNDALNRSDRNEEVDFTMY